MSDNAESPNAPLPLSSPWFWSVPAITLLAAAAIATLDANQSLFLWLNTLGGTAAADLLWANATLLGDTLAAFALLGLFVHRRFDIVWALLLAALFTTLWVHGLKHTFETLRPLAMLGPDQVHVIGVALHRASFPSGHTATAFTLAGIICLQRVPRSLALGVVALATLAGISRAAVGAHWPLDILGGAFGGWSCAIIGVMLARRWPTPSKASVHIGVTLALLLCALTLLGWHDSGYPGAYPLQIIIGGLSVISLLHALWVLRQSHRLTRR